MVLFATIVSITFLIRLRINENLLKIIHFFKEFSVVRCIVKIEMYETIYLNSICARKWHQKCVIDDSASGKALLF